MKRILALTVLLLALAGAAACGGSSDTGQLSSEHADAALHFARCLREHGMNVPDPDPNSDHLPIRPSDSTQTAWSAAKQACAKYLPDGEGGEKPAPDELQAQIALATCLRNHGIEVTDPDPDTGKFQTAGRLANATRTELDTDPAYRAALAACGVPQPGATP